MNTSMLPRDFLRRIIQPAFLSNISIRWKMGLMVLALFLGIAGIATSGYIGLQSLRYQLSNIYDFMLIPIVAINHADTALADSQFHIEQLHIPETTASEVAQGLADILSNDQTAEDTIARYDAEWVTTVSPEFTQALRDSGKLGLQQEEVAILAELHASFDAYKISNEKYLITVRAGNAEPALAHESIESLELARSHLQRLIEINNEYADFSNQAADEAFRQALFNGGVVLVLSLVLGLLMSYLFAVSITVRLGELTRSALDLQEGKLEQTAAVGGRDEVGILGTTFNSMVKQLKELLGTLEQRVADRTRDLAIVAEVGTVASTILERNRLLQEVVDLTKDRFKLYHTHIYLLDETGENLVLAAGAGEPGRQMLASGLSIPLDREQSLVARAARERKGITVNDVTQAQDFLPNPLLPDTRAELAVPMLVGNTLIGVFDIQSDQVGRFTDSDINIQTTMAAQLATSIQNVRSFEQFEAKAELETLVNTIGQKIQQTTSVEDTLQIAIREIGLAVGASRVSVRLSNPTGSSIGASQN